MFSPSSGFPPLLSACDPGVVIVRPAAADFTIDPMTPRAYKPGGVVSIKGAGFSESIFLSIKSLKYPLEFVSPSEVLFKIPELPGLALAGESGVGKIPMEMNRRGISKEVHRVYLAAASDYPLITEAASEVCAGKKFYNVNGELTEGTKDCSAGSGQPVAACSADGEVGCVTTSTYKAADLSKLISANVRNGTTIAGVLGTLTDCSAIGVSGCVTTPTYKSADLTNLTSANVRNGTVIAGVGGTYPSIATPLASNTATADLTSFGSATSAGSYEFFDSTGTKYTATVASGGTIIPTTSAQAFGAAGTMYHSFNVAGDANLTIGNIKSGVSIFGVGGNVTPAPANCSANGTQSCVATGSYYAAAACAANGSNCFIPDYVVSSQPLKAISFDAIDAGKASMRSPLTLAGVPGTLLDCTTNETSGCVTTSTYQSADLTNLSVDNIKKGVVIAGKTGSYPSGASPLAGSDTTADLNFATFDAQIKSAANFEWFDSAGNRYATAGDPDITAPNIADNVTIFGATGNLDSCAVVSLVYDGNSATSGAAPIDPQSYPCGSSAVAANNPGSLAKTGFEFAGWNTAADGSGANYIAGETITIGRTQVTLFAKWAATLCGGIGDDCYSDAVAIAAGVAVTPSGKAIVLSQGVWVESGSGTRVLATDGSDNWAYRLTPNGRTFDTILLNKATSSLAGRECLPNVFYNGNFLATGRCLYFDSGSGLQRLDSPNNDAITDQTTPGSLRLGPWTSANGGNGTGASWYEGNIQTCASKGMRLPTLYEVRGVNADGYSPSDAPQWPSHASALSKGIASYLSWTWTATASTYQAVGYFVWNGNTVSATTTYGNSYYVRCVIP